MQSEIDHKEEKNKFDDLNLPLLSVAIDVEDVSVERQREFRFIWTSLQPSALPYELDVDVLYIVKVPATIFNLGRETNTIYWSEEDKTQSATIDNSILLNLNFITFPGKNKSLQFKLLEEFQSRQLVMKLQPLFNFSAEEIPYILQGPRQKTLATQHLEFIVKNYLMTPHRSRYKFSVEYLPDNEDCIVSFDGFNFNLSAILRTNPGFDQIRFTSYQLDQVDGKKFTGNSSTYHSAEKKAVDEWMHTHQPMNDFLRHRGKKGVIPESLVLTNLLTICLLAHALNRPYCSPEISRKLYRGECEEFGNDFLEIRQEAVQEKKLVVNRGFTATSANKNSAYRFGKIKTTFIEMAHWNPTAKDISSLESGLVEYESLISPGQEVRYRLEKKDSWTATLFRSINQEEQKDNVYENHFYNDLSVIKAKIQHYDLLKEGKKSQIVEFMGPIENTRRSSALKKGSFTGLLTIVFALLGTDSVLSLVDKSVIWEKNSDSNLAGKVFLIIIAAIFFLAGTYLAKNTYYYAKEARNIKLPLYTTKDEVEQISPEATFCPCV